MLLWFVIIYWIISVGIGLWAGTRVHNYQGLRGGRAQPAAATSSPRRCSRPGSAPRPCSAFRQPSCAKGLGGVIADPFGSSLCLVLVGLFFARPLYRMNLLTIGDFYRNHYGRAVEALTTLCIVISYLGWVAAQITALGLVFNVVSDGAMSQQPA